MIEEYIPMVVEWYNDIDISEDIPYDFIDEDVYEIEKVKEYKTNKHIFLRVKKER